MPEIIIYTTKTCPYCIKAKALFNQKSLNFTEIDVTDNTEMREELIHKASGRRTVPQIFIGSHHVGGCDDLYALENAGKLDVMLAN